MTPERIETLLMGRETLVKRIAELEAERENFERWRKTKTEDCRVFMEENARLRQALENAPHDLTCHSVTERHILGLTHYETDIEDERCPRYHFKCGPCDCWKAALDRSPEAK